MRLFAIGDLHMSGGDDKPMDIFGPQWDRHFFHIRENWLNLVTDEDAVLIPGDISWAMQLQEAEEDLAEIGRLPGRKVLCKGNHDYWWNSISRVRSAVPPSITVLQHSAADMGDFVVCGTRGWMIPTKDAPLGPQDEKIFLREAERLRLALDAAAGMADGRPLIAMMHFPPLLNGETDTAYTALMEEYHVHTAVYGHLHGAGIQNGFTGEHNGIRYELVSCDSIGFAPKLILEK
ncbi:MAG: metallophosphoesterase [Clostridia bacterium]|nr:metallophosphoesterase [Clostridia bacterium]